MSTSLIHWAAATNTKALVLNERPKSVQQVRNRKKQTLTVWDIWGRQRHSPTDSPISKDLSNGHLAATNVKCKHGTI